MEQTSNLKMPYIAPSQAQKHVTHNEALRALDALVQLCVVSRNGNVPPAKPLEGQRYIVGSPAADLWKARENHIAAWQDRAWAFFPAQEGWHAWVEEEKGFVVFSQGRWTAAQANTNPVSRLGIEAAADDTNRLSVKSPASLFDHAGGGHQLKINKADDNQAASLLFQSNYQGRAEMGTLWGRDFRIKTSVDGARWCDVMVADSSSGLARFPAGIASTATGKKQSGLVFLPESAAIFEPASSPVSTAIVSAATNFLNLNKGMAPAIFTAAMRGMAMIRVWNVTRTPAQSAWVKWDTSADQLQVSNADHIGQWLKGDVIQTADPVKKNIAIDISPLMQKMFGTVFLQDAVLLCAGTVEDVTIACNEQSPVSSSNLICFKADEKRSFSAIGIYG